MTKKQIDEFETLQGQLESFHREMNTLVKKNPNDALNKFKLGLINSILKKANAFLGRNKRPFGDFEQFEEESMPSTSDVLMIISQYLSAFEKMRADNIYQKAGVRWMWICADSDDDLRTAPPKKLEN
jgi:secreted Zn-dependent insulinase-like peptidase